MTVERVKEIRRAESERAAGLLGAEVRFFDAGDYPLRPSDDLVDGAGAGVPHLRARRSS